MLTEDRTVWPLSHSHCCVEGTGSQPSLFNPHRDAVVCRVRVGRQPPVGVNVDPLAVNEELCSLGALFDEASGSRHMSGCRVVHPVAEFKPFQAFVVERPICHGGGCPTCPASAAGPCSHPVPESEVRSRRRIGVNASFLSRLGSGCCFLRAFCAASMPELESIAFWTPVIQHDP